MKPKNCKKVTITVTGHRFWTNSKKEKAKLFRSLDSLLTFLPKEIVFIHGCAYGVDTWFGEFARINGFEFHLYFPFDRIIQIVRSPKEYDLPYTKELNKQYEAAEKIVYVNDTFFTYGYQKRNIALVDNTDILCTYYTRQRSGSGNCYRYAVSKGLPVVSLRTEKEYLQSFVSRLKAEVPVTIVPPRNDKCIIK